MCDVEWHCTIINLPVSHLLYCLNFSYLMTPVSCILSHISSLLSPVVVSSLLSPVCFLWSVVSSLLSPVSCLLYPVSCLHPYHPTLGHPHHTPALHARPLHEAEEGRRRRKKKGDGRQEKGDKKWKRRNRRRKAGKGRRKLGDKR